MQRRNSSTTYTISMNPWNLLKGMEFEVILKSLRSNYSKAWGHAPSLLRGEATFRQCLENHMVLRIKTGLSISEACSPAFLANTCLQMVPWFHFICVFSTCLVWQGSRNSHIIPLAYPFTAAISRISYFKCLLHFSWHPWFFSFQTLQILTKILIFQTWCNLITYLSYVH